MAPSSDPQSPPVQTPHLLPRVFVCFHLLSPSNSHPVAPAWRRADLVFLSLVGLQVAVSAPVFGSDRGVGAPGSRCVPQCSSALKSANVRLIGISARCSGAVLVRRLVHTRNIIQ